MSNNREEYCLSCNGTGEGDRDGAKCRHCRGSGLEADAQAEIERRYPLATFASRLVKGLPL